MRGDSAALAGSRSACDRAKTSGGRCGGNVGAGGESEQDDGADCERFNAEHWGSSVGVSSQRTETARQ